MVKAKDMKKVLNTKWIEKRWKDVEESKFGRKVFYIGNHVVSKASSDQFAKELVQNGFTVSYDMNGHGVKLLVIEW